MPFSLWEKSITKSVTIKKVWSMRDGGKMGRMQLPGFILMLIIALSCCSRACGYVCGCCCDCDYHSDYILIIMIIMALLLLLLLLLLLVFLMLLLVVVVLVIVLSSFCYSKHTAATFLVKDNRVDPVLTVSQPDQKKVHKAAAQPSTASQ